MPEAAAAIQKRIWSCDATAAAQLITLSTVVKGQPSQGGVVFSASTLPLITNTPEDNMVKKSNGNRLDRFTT